MSDGSYSLIWSGLSAKLQQILLVAAKTKSSQIKDIRESMGMAPNEFSPYRDTLGKCGIINTSEYGKMTFALPRFENFVLKMEYFM